MARTSLRGQRGFTLLELLVVIAIIAILAAAVIANLNSATTKANDSSIRQDLNQIKNAVTIGTTAAGNLAGSGYDTSGNENLPQLKRTLEDANLLKPFPDHPDTPNQEYHYKGRVVNGVLEYVTWGKLSTGADDCFIVKNGSSFEGSCTTGIGF